MSWTYTGNPTTVPLDAARFWCGDTDSANPLLQDGEVTYAMSMQPNDIRLAAAICLDAISNKYARLADVTVGEVSKRNGDRSETYRKRAIDMRAEAGKLAVPFFGGQSQSAKDTLGQNTDAVQPPFAMRQFDNPLSRQFDESAPDPNVPVP